MKPVTPEAFTSSSAALMWCGAPDATLASTIVASAAIDAMVFVILPSKGTAGTPVVRVMCVGSSIADSVTRISRCLDLDVVETHAAAPPIVRGVHHLHGGEGRCHLDPPHVASAGRRLWRHSSANSSRSLLSTAPTATNTWSPSFHQPIRLPCFSLVYTSTCWIVCSDSPRARLSVPLRMKSESR